MVYTSEQYVRERAPVQVVQRGQQRARAARRRRPRRPRRPRRRPLRARRLRRRQHRLPTPHLLYYYINATYTNTVKTYLPTIVSRFKVMLMRVSEIFERTEARHSR